VIKVKFDKILGMLREGDEASGQSESCSFDGGFANSVYLATQSFDGGSA